MKQYVAILYNIKTYDTLLQWKIKHTNRYIVMNIKIVYTQLKKTHMTNEMQKKKKKKKDGTTIYNKTYHGIYLHQKALYYNVYNINHLSSHKNLN